MMDERSFWLGLEYRLCDEFAGLSERRYRYFWCDGFSPSDYRLDGPAPRITGRCWICNGPRQSEWDFALLPPAPVGSRDEIEWASLLPPRDVTRWMAFDEDRRYVEIDTAVAVADLAEPIGEAAPREDAAEPRACTGPRRPEAIEPGKSLNRRGRWRDCSAYEDTPL